MTPQTCAVHEDVSLQKTLLGLNEYLNEPMSITIDLSRDELLSESSFIQFKEGQYMLPSEVSPQEALGRAAIAYASSKEHAQRLYDYASQLWFMFASPVLSSAGNNRGNPISCFLTSVDDDREDIANAFQETLWLSTEGGGVGADWSSIRSVGERTSRGTYTPGLIPFLKAIDSITLASIQGGVRRGASAVYLDISHPEVIEFIESRRATGGDSNRKLTNIHNAINIPDKFMEAVRQGIHWDLIDPHSKQVKKTVLARDLWKKILEVRLETGEPYLHFIDTTNKHLPEFMKKLGLSVKNSNLCSEITLPTSRERTAVCCLSSVNLEFFDEFSQVDDFVPDLIEMLDNVLTVFINKAPSFLQKAVYSATRERSIGLGTMGFHLYLQKKGIPFEGVMAKSYNVRIFKHISEKAKDKTRLLATEKGEAPDAEGYGVRNSHLLAIAPNASSGILCNNSSPSIEPYNANVYLQKTGNGSFVIKNRALDLLLKVKYNLYGKELESVWDTILRDNGSVQNLNFMDALDKDVFKTAFELDQRWVIEHAADRQPFICQAQSVNLFFRPGVSATDVHRIHFSAWEKGLKTLYYCRSKNVGKAADTSAKLDITTAPVSECLSCEG